MSSSTRDWMVSLAIVLVVFLTGCASMEPSDTGAGALDPPPEAIVLPLDEENEAHHQAMREALSARELDQAQADHERIGPEYHHHPDVRADRAVLARLSDDHALAKQLYREVLTIEPGHPVAANDLALMARETGDMEKAESLLLEALKVHPERPRLHFNLAVLYELYLMELAKALEHYEQYQASSGEPDERVSGWIQDLERRVEG